MSKVNFASSPHRMARGPDLFSRVELHRKTGIPDDVLNYWLREGVLRAREGGDGRGNPRRFDYPEIMLAAILDELRSFGLNVAALKGLSERFHQAIDFFRTRRLNNKNYIDFVELVDRKFAEEEGRGAWGHTTTPEKFPQYDWTQSKHRPEIYSSDMTFEDLTKNPELWPSEDIADEDLDQVIEWAKRTDPEDVYAHLRYWSLLVSISKSPTWRDADHFARDTTGQWHLTPGDPTGRSWITVATAAINWELWQGDQSLRD